MLYMLGGVSGDTQRMLSPPSFSNAMLKNIGDGNTMLLKNRTLLCRLNLSNEHKAHDRLAYMIINGVGSRVLGTQMLS